MSSNVSTPLLEPTSSVTLQPPSPSPLAHPPTAATLDDADIPPLSLDVLTSRHDKVEALKLIADSVAQQRQRAAFSLVVHPLLAGVLGAVLAVSYHLSRRTDLGMVLTLGSGIIMTYLMAIRFASSGYIRLAESIDWDWLASEDGEQDTVVGTRFGNEMIGALVLRLEPAAPSAAAAPRRRNRGAPTLRGGRGVIRAWTTKLRYRHKGVGGDLLHEAVRITREKCGKDAEVGFAQEHANSTMVLPEFFNGTFRKDEIKAARMLEGVLSEWEGSKRKR